MMKITIIKGQSFAELGAERGGVIAHVGSWRREVFLIYDKKLIWADNTQRTQWIVYNLHKRCFNFFIVVAERQNWKLITKHK